jgi:hypothetical protein
MVKSSMFATVFGLKQLAILTAFQVPFLGLPVILGKPRPSGRDAESGCTMLYCLCRDDNQVLALDHQVCRVPKGRRGPDRL